MLAMVPADSIAVKKLQKYFNFLPSSTMEFPAECYVTPQMPHSRRKYVQSHQ